MRFSKPNAAGRPALLARLDLDDAALDELARRVASILQDAMPAEPASPYLTTAEAGEYLRASRQRIFDLTSQGRLPVHKDGSRNRYKRADLDAYLAGQNGGER